MSTKTNHEKLADLWANREERSRISSYGPEFVPWGGWSDDGLKKLYLSSLAVDPSHDDSWDEMKCWRLSLHAPSEDDVLVRSVESESPKAEPASRTAVDRYDDSGLGDAFVAAHPELIWNMTKNRWLRYDATKGIWRYFDEQEANAEIDRFLKRLQAEGEAALGKDKFSAGKLLGSQRTQEAVSKKIKTKHHIKQEQLDADPYLQVFANGVFDPRKPEAGMGPFDPKLYATRAVPLDYDPSAKHDRLADVLAALPDDAHEWYQLMAGQSMLGFQPAAEFAIFMYGPTASNGKSLHFNLMESTAGAYDDGSDKKTGYFGRPDQATLLSGENYDLVSFQGLRQAGIEELPDKQLQSSPFKRLIGTESFKGRQIYAAHETVSNRATIWITCNIFPTIDAQDAGVVRRIKVLPFDKKYVNTEVELATFPAGKAYLKDPSLKEAVEHDRGLKEAFLAFRMEGAIRWCATPADKRAQLEGNTPESVNRATLARVGQQDTLQTWIDDCIIFDATEDAQGNRLPAQNFCLTTDLFSSYTAHLKANGHAYGVKITTFQDRFELNGQVQARHLHKVRGRTSGLKQSLWENADGVSVRAGVTPAHVRGLRFRTELDDHEISAGLTADEVKRMKIVDILQQMQSAGITLEDLTADQSRPEVSHAAVEADDFDDEELAEFFS